MDGNWLKQIKGLLVERSLQIERRVGSASSIAPLAEVPTHSEFVDIAQTLEQLGRDTSLAEQDRREWISIQRALNKISHGSFGVCEECDEEIPKKRILVLPEARYCADCQAREERQHAKMFQGRLAS